MTTRPPKPNAKYEPVPGYKHLKRHSVSGIYYVRTSVRGKGEIFRSTGERTVGKANTVAQEILFAVSAGKRGKRGGRIQIHELCDIALVDLEKQTRTSDGEGGYLRRMSTYSSKDRCFLRGKEHRARDAQGEPMKRKGMREQGVIRDLFGEHYADEIDEVFFKTWVRREGKKLGRRLDDIAKYLSLVLRYAFDEGFIERKPELVLPEKFRKHKRKAVKYTDAQVIAFFKKAKPLLQDLIVIGSENPLRPHENYEIPWSMVIIVRAKSGKPKLDKEGNPFVYYDLQESFVKKNARKIRLTPHAARVVLRRFEENLALPPSKRSPYVFPAPSDPKKPIGRVRVNRYWRQMKKACGIAKETKVHFHWFRHNVFRRLLKIHGMGYGAVGQVGGTSEKTLKRHYDLEEEEVIDEAAGAVSIPFDDPQSAGEEE